MGNPKIWSNSKYSYEIDSINPIPHEKYHVTYDEGEKDVQVGVLGQLVWLFLTSGAYRSSWASSLDPT